MKLIAIAAVLALVAGGVDVEAQNIGDQGGSRDHKFGYRSIPEFMASVT